MRIAQSTSVYLPVPPPTHGGTELMVHYLTEELVRRGHDVHLYASGDSKTSAVLHAVNERATLTDAGATIYADKELETRAAFELYRDADFYDVIHAHWPTLAPYFASTTKTPTLLTYHYIERSTHDYYREHVPNVQPVCVSHRQAEMLGEPDLPVVYDGLDMDAVPFNESPEDFLVLVARMLPTKGIADAIRIAARASVRLVLIGPVTTYIPWSRTYFDEQVRPHVDGDRVVHIPEAPNRRVLELVSHAKGFLFPLQGEEPFGLAVLEAMATGTPVITMRRGAMPELVADRVSGFLVESDFEAVRAIGELESLDRRLVRGHVSARFTYQRMVDGYESLYQGIAIDPK